MELELGENIVWTGRPMALRSWPTLLPGLLGALFVGLPVTVLSFNFLRAGAVFPVVLGLTFGAMGLWVISSPWIFLRRARRSRYVLTDRRFILQGPIPASYSIDTLCFLTCLESRKGDGDLHVRFGKVSVDLMGIEEVRRVEELFPSRRQAK